LPKKIERQQREPTKRQLSHWQKENRRQKIIMLSGIIVIVAVLALVGSGWYMNLYKPLHTTAVKVNNTEYDTNYYIDMLAYYGLMTGNPSYIPYLGEQAVQQIVQDQLIKEAADKLNIKVTDDEINKALKDQKLADTPTRRDVVRANLLANKLLTDYFGDANNKEWGVPASAEQRKISAMFLESQKQVDAVKARLAKGENFNDIAGELSLDPFTQTNKGDLDWRPQGVVSVSVVGLNNGGSEVLDKAAFEAKLDVVGDAIADEEQTKSLGYWIIKIPEDMKDSPKSAHVMGILLGSLEDALKVKDRLAKGEDFATVAKEVSLVSSAETDGGDLGWVNEGSSLSKPVNDLVFSKKLAVNTLSDPIKDDTQKTNGGYWLIKVTGIENKNIEGQNRDVLKNKKFNEWFRILTDDPANKVENLLTEEQKAYAVQKAISR
jgi:parvulin-like peptidyl-prolyl isomerase